MPARNGGVILVQRLVAKIDLDRFLGWEARWQISSQQMLRHQPGPVDLWLLRLHDHSRRNCCNQ